MVLVSCPSLAVGLLDFKWRMGKGFMSIEQWSKVKESYSTLSMVLWSLCIDLLIYIT